MEDLAAAKMQVLETERAILAANDAELAFVLQALETMNSIVLPQRLSFPDPGSSKKEPECSLHTGDGDGLVEGMEEDRHNAIQLSILERGNLTREIADREMALKEASRFSQLDMIQEHDSQFARSLADLPQRVWDNTGDHFSDPCVPVPDVAYEEGAGAEDQEVVVLAQSLFGSKSVERLEQEQGKREVCQICIEENPVTSFFNIEGCQHRFCVICISKHAETRCRSGELFVNCPSLGCLNTLTFSQYSQLLSSESLRILSTRQTEAAIPETQRLYCPYPDCSSLLMKPEFDISKQSTSSAHPHMTAVGCVECVACHRAFCLECAVPWHGDLSCAEYQEELKTPGKHGDKKLLELAESRKWQRCRKCERIIELQFGCNHITCLCGHQFCYLCGAAWINRQRTCTCSLWSEANIVS